MSKSKRSNQKINNLASKDNFQDAAMVQEKDKSRGRNRNNSIVSKGGKPNHAGGRSNKFKPSYQNKGKGSKFGTDLGVDQPKNNDPMWYYNNEALLRNVASFSFSSPIGTRTGLGETLGFPKDSAQSAGMESNVTVSPPGVMAYRIGLTPGIATDNNSPLNIASINLFQETVYKNNKRAVFNNPDYMMYLLAMDSLYACWNWMKRLYGMISHTSPENYYLPRALFEIENVDFEDILNNLANLRKYLNIKATEISKFNVPALMTYFKRHSWLFANIFTDSETEKAQIYMYIPAYFYKYDETTSREGGKLVPVIVNNSYNASTKIKYDDLKNIMDQLLLATQYSQDIGEMSGFTAAAWRDLLTLTIIDDDYRVIPAYSQEVLMQIENATILTLVDSEITQQFGVAQDPNTNFLKFQPNLEVGALTIAKKVLNFHKQQPTPQDVMVATRLCAILEERGTTTTTQKVLGVGSEMFLGAFIVVAQTRDTIVATDKRTTPIKYKRYGVGIDIVPNNKTVEKAVNNAMIVWAFAAFDWHPLIYLAVDMGDKKTVDTGVYLYFPMMDYDQFTVIDKQNIIAMHEVALLSEFGIK